jgi:CheY-like chemotaxis protein
MPRILIVEDEPTVRGLLCELLSPHECRPAKSAVEGLALLSRTPFELVVTDVRLPGMGGEEFLREAHERAPGMPVIVITGRLPLRCNRAAGPMTPELLSGRRLDSPKSGAKRCRARASATLCKGLKALL